MLSRVADSIYWMSRYVERAEHVARLLDVNETLMLDVPGAPGQQWLPLVHTTGDNALFAARYPEGSAENVIRFLTFDEENPNSILSCMRGARENARSIREVISSEMWEQLNVFYLMVTGAAAAALGAGRGSAFYAQVRQASHLFGGITDATLTHGEAWQFLRLGRMLERADKTSRIVDVKYYILLPSVADVGTPADDIQWAAVLRSASAFEMYRKRHSRIAPRDIVEFLLLDPEFPRAVRFCLDHARQSLHAISGTPMGSFRSSAERHLGLLCSDLAYARVDEIIDAGLHEYVDELQTQMNRVGQGVYETFFARRVPESTRRGPVGRLL